MSIDVNKKVDVKNRTSGSVGYTLPNLRQRRIFPYEGFTINVPVSELIELRGETGGYQILNDCLQIMDEEVAKYVLDLEELEPEYNYGPEEVELLLYQGEDAQLADALEFAPNGVLDLIKAKAIQKLPNTTAKVKMINEKFNIDLNTVQSNLKIEDGEVTKEAAAPVKKVVRRSAPINKKTS